MANDQLPKTQMPVVTPVETTVHPPSGRHLLLRLSGCEFNVLNDESGIRELAKEAALASGATVLEVISHRFSPQGVTALVLLAESHASLHTYPEAGLLFWDCFTCGDTCDPVLSIDVLKSALNPTDVHAEIILRS